MAFCHSWKRQRGWNETLRPPFSTMNSTLATPFANNPVAACALTNSRG